MANSNSILSPYKILPMGPEHKYLRIFSYFIMKLYVVYNPLESPHWGDSNEYTKHAIIVWKIERISLNCRVLLPDLAPWLTLMAQTAHISNTFQ